MSGSREPIREGGFDDLREAVAPVSERFTAAGHRLYLVGGLVRDRLMGLVSTNDHDLTTDATPDLVREIVEDVADAVWLQGERFGSPCGPPALQPFSHVARLHPPLAEAKLGQPGQRLTDLRTGLQAQ